MQSGSDNLDNENIERVKPRAPSAGAALSALFMAFALNLASGYAIAYVPSQWFPLGLLLVELISFGLPCLFFMRSAEVSTFLIPARAKRARVGVSRIPVADEASAVLPPPYGRAIFFGVVASMFLMGVVSLWQSFIYVRGVDVSMLTYELNTGSLVMTLLVAAVAPAVCEELFFRGVLLTSLERYGAGFAVFVSGAMFAMMHVEIAALPVHLILGLTLSLVAYASRNIFIPMIIHGSYNATLICLNYYVSTLGLSAESTSGASAYVLTAEASMQIILQTLLYFMVFASLLRALLIRASIGTADDVKPARVKPPVLVLVGVALLFLVFGAMYVFETLMLMGKIPI